MPDTLFADVSEFQVNVGDQYPHQFISIRSNDGNYRDHHFTFNLAWAKHACDTGKLAGFLVYIVWEPNWRETLDTFKSMIGSPHPKMAVMLDAETWGGRIRGDQSIGLNAARENLITWLHGNRDRVIGYGNAGDLNSIWLSRGDCHFIIANYGQNLPFPGKIAHQFANNYNTPPFGPCDINSADGYTPEQFAARLGLHGGSPVASPPVQAPPLPKPKPPVRRTVTYVVQSGDTLSSIGAKYNVPWLTIYNMNRGVIGSNPNHVETGVRLTIQTH